MYDGRRGMVCNGIDDLLNMGTYASMVDATIDDYCSRVEGYQPLAGEVHPCLWFNMLGQISLIN